MPSPAIVRFIITLALTTLVLPIIVPILRMRRKAGRCGYAKNKSERQNKPANFSSKMFHIFRISPLGRKMATSVPR